MCREHSIEPEKGKLNILTNFPNTQGFNFKVLNFEGGGVENPIS